jgi:hypothetical protein
MGSIAAIEIAVASDSVGVGGALWCEVCGQLDRQLRSEVDPKGSVVAAAGGVLEKAERFGYRAAASTAAAV